MENPEELKNRLATERRRKTNSIYAQQQEKFILKLMEKDNISRQAAWDVINRFYEGLLYTLAEADVVSLRNVGRFVVSKTRLNQKYATIKFHMAEAQRRRFTKIKEECKEIN